MVAFRFRGETRSGIGSVPVGAPSSDQARALAEAKFKKKDLESREGQKAMAEYVAAGVAEREKTARLRALREAKQAAEAAKGKTSVETISKSIRARKTRATQISGSEPIRPDAAAAHI